MTTPKDNEVLLDNRALSRLRKQFQDNGAIISIAGPDGSGKTTLASQLFDAFTAADLPVRHIHSYVWHHNLFRMPFTLGRLKTGNTTVILDRSIYDNVIVAFSRLKTPRWMLAMALRGVSFLYPAFDLQILLHAPFECLKGRRPEESSQDIRMQVVNYSLLESQLNFTKLESVRPLLSDVLSILTDEPV